MLTGYALLQDLSDELKKLNSDSLLFNAEADDAKIAKVQSNIATVKQRRVTTNKAIETAKNDLHDAKRLVAVS